MMSFSETEAWYNTVKKTYKLKEKIFKNGLHIFNNKHSDFSSAPYATDSGNIEWEDNLLDEKKYLIKSRNPIPILEDKGLLCLDYFTFILKLSSDIQDVWDNTLKSKTRNQVRKALKNDLKVKIGNKELLDDFYSVISTAWRDLGTPTHSKAFYKNILSSFGERQAKVIILYFEDKPVSTALLITNNNHIFHPYAATLKKYNHLSLNNALYWHIIKYAVENKIPYFDMGRSHKEQGTYRYKKSWGAKPIQLYYYYIGYNKIPDFHSKKIQILTKIWSKMPLFICNKLGPYFIKNIL